MLDILVVGAGMVGWSAALAMAKKGFRVGLIEKKRQSDFTSMQDFTSDLRPYDTKVVALSRATERFFEGLGIWERIQNSRFASYERMFIWDSVADGNITFSASDFYEYNLGYIVEQNVILHALWHAGHEQSSLSLYEGATITNIAFFQEEVRVTLDSGVELKTRLLIGADGAHSFIRRYYHIPTVSWEYNQSAIIAMVCGTKPHNRTAFQRFAPDGPLALLPLVDQHQASIVWTTTPERALYLSQMEETAFSSLLQREVDQVMGEMQLQSARSIFPLQAQHAQRYFGERMVLVGDAAHTLHPLAGLGVNLGFKDVFVLAKILSEAQKQGRPFYARRILQRYERERKLHNRLVIYAMEALKRGFGSRAFLVEQWRNRALNWVDSRAFFKQIFVKMALET